MELGLDLSLGLLRSTGCPGQRRATERHVLHCGLGARPWASAIKRGHISRLLQGTEEPGEETRRFWETSLQRVKARCSQLLLPDWGPMGAGLVTQSLVAETRVK